MSATFVSNLLVISLNTITLIFPYQNDLANIDLVNVVRITTGQTLNYFRYIIEFYIIFTTTIFVVSLPSWYFYCDNRRSGAFKVSQNS